MNFSLANLRLELNKIVNVTVGLLHSAQYVEVRIRFTVCYVYSRTDLILMIYLKCGSQSRTKHPGIVP